MSYLSEHIIPTQHGQTFESNIDSENKFEQLKETLLSMKSIVDVECENSEENHLFEVTITTDGPVEIAEVQKEAKHIDVHLIPKSSFFPLNL